VFYGLFGLERGKIVALGYNARKAQTLAIFDSRGLLSPPEWAFLARFYPIRASYSYLVRLHRFGLLRRSRDARGRVAYSLSARGRRRLAWLLAGSSK
jgi:hypothetical protein